MPTVAINRPKPANYLCTVFIVAATPNEIFCHSEHGPARRRFIWRIYLDCRHDRIVPDPHERQCNRQRPGEPYNHDADYQAKHGETVFHKVGFMSLLFVQQPDNLLTVTAETGMLRSRHDLNSIFDISHDVCTFPPAVHFGLQLQHGLVAATIAHPARRMSLLCVTQERMNVQNH